MEESVEKWISVDEVAKHLGVAAITIYRWLEKGRIPAHRVGKLWRFKPSQIDEWVKSGNASEDIEEQNVQMTNASLVIGNSKC